MNRIANGVRNYVRAAAPSNGGNVNPFAQVKNILRKYGTDAHVYLPGIGVINGLTAGNYLDSAGTTAATVDNPVGLVLDANNTIGPELVTNGGFDTDTAWTKGTGWTIADGKATHAAGASAYLSQSTTLTSGRTFLFTFTVSGRTAGTVGARLENAINRVVSADGIYSEYIVTTSNNPRIILSADSAFVGSVDNISVKEVTGIHALQATTANKPILRRGAVNLLTYSEQFDNAAWAGFGTAVTANQITAPNGTLTADKGTISGSDVLRNTNALSVTTATTYTQSYYFKKNDFDWIRIVATDTTTGTNSVRVWFNLSIGVLGSNTTTGTGWGYVSSSISSVGDGWYRCSITFTTTGAAYYSIVASADANASLTRAANGSSYYLWGAQLETGSTASTYIPTTTAPASSPSGNYWWQFDSTDVLTATFPAGYESSTIVDAPKSGQATLTAQNIVGTYNIGPSIDTYGRFVFKTITASELATIQTYCNRLAGL